MIAAVLQELIEQEAVRTMDSDTVEVGIECIPSCVPEGLDDLRYLVRFQRTRRLDLTSPFPKPAWENGLIVNSAGYLTLSDRHLSEQLRTGRFQGRCRRSGRYTRAPLRALSR